MNRRPADPYRRSGPHADRHVLVIDLRLVCDRPENYALPIEPSLIGGEKIVRVIAQAVEGPTYRGPGAHVIGL